MLMIHRDLFNDITLRAPAVAVKIYKLIFQLHCSLFIKDKEPKLYLPPQQLVSEEFYVELDVSNPVAFQDRSSLRTISQPPIRQLDQGFQSDAPPLFLFYQYSEQLKPIQKPLQRPEIQGSIFLVEKLEKQRIEDEASRKSGKRSGKRSPSKKRITEDMKKELAKTEGGYVDYIEELEGAIEEIKKSKEEHDGFRKRIESLEAENKLLKEKLIKEELLREHLEVKLQKHSVNRDIGRWEDIKPTMNSAQQKVLNRNFHDITYEQIKAHKKLAIIYKYAMKWLDIVKKRKRDREIAERKRFWPGD